MGKITVFLDTNVVMEYVARRQHFLSVARIIDLALRKKLSIAISALTFVNVAYIMRKATKEDIILKLSQLYNLSTVPPISDCMIGKALEDNPKDFEDYIQYQSALQAKADIIMTYDTSGFTDAELPVMTAEEFVDKCS